MLDWFKRIFAKEDNNIKITLPKNKMEFRDIKFKFNIKSICYFEKLKNKSFFELGEDDIFDLLYSIYMVNNPDKQMKQNVFINIITKREDIFKWMMREYMTAAEIWTQFQDIYVEKEDPNSNIGIKEAKPSRMGDFVSTLIIEYGVDPHYIYYEMDMWEISQLFEAIDTMVKRKLEEERFWTYLKIAPHIDIKKCKSPEALIPFDWDKDKIHKKQMEELENNAYAVKSLIGGNIFGKKENKDG